MPTATITRPRLDRSLLIQKIAKLAAEQRRRHRAFALPHGSKEFREALGLPATGAYYVCRDAHSDELTALHIALAESRGKVHCDVDSWSDHPSRENCALWIVAARKLITEIPALDVK